MLRRTVIIDDDPTGCQTVHDIPLYFRWDRETLSAALEKDDAFFILTNTRALDSASARAVSEEVAANLAAVSAGIYELVILSRSDSTLRGHLLEEVLPLAGHFGSYDALVLVPAFFEGDRYTVDNMHYVRTAEGMLPASKTEFASDPVFGYSTSLLPEWVEEVSGGYFNASEAVSISHATIMEGRAKVESLLSSAAGFVPVIVNALNYSELEIVYEAIASLMAAGRRYLFRTAASMVRVCLSQSRAHLYMPATRSAAGLVVAGSYTGKTSAQLDALLHSHPGIESIMIDVEKIFGTETQEYSSIIAAMVDAALAKGRDTVLYTSREYLSDTGLGDAVSRGRTISGFIVSVCRQITVRPDFIIGKGGITSLTMARDGFGAVSAIVKGQIADGVPVWVLPEESRFPGIDFVVFPGNVGNEGTLTETFNRFVNVL